MVEKEKLMIALKDIDKKWYIIDSQTFELKLREDAPDDVKKAFNENKKALDDFEKHIYREFGKKHHD